MSYHGDFSISFEKNTFYTEILFLLVMKTGQENFVKKFFFWHYYYIITEGKVDFDIHILVYKFCLEIDILCEIARESFWKIWTYVVCFL